MLRCFQQLPINLVGFFGLFLFVLDLNIVFVEL